MRLVVRIWNPVEHDAKADLPWLPEASVLALLRGDFQPTSEKVCNETLSRASRVPASENFFYFQKHLPVPCLQWGSWYLQENRRVVLQGPAKLRDSLSIQRRSEVRGAWTAREDSQDDKARHGDWVRWRRRRLGRRHAWRAQSRQKRIVQQQLPQKPKPFQFTADNWLWVAPSVWHKLASEEITCHALQPPNELKWLAKVNEQPQAAD